MEDNIITVPNKEEYGPYIARIWPYSDCTDREHVPEYKKSGKILVGKNELSHHEFGHFSPTFFPDKINYLVGQK